jgi:hypothetical protein
MESNERTLTPTDTIDVPLPAEELLKSLESDSAAGEDYVQVEEIPRAAGHFAASYRRC